MIIEFVFTKLHISWEKIMKYFFSCKKIVILLKISQMRVFHCFYISIILFFALCSQSCKKPEDQFPEFFIEKPFENSQWSVGDTIPFQISMPIAIFVKQVKVQLETMSMQPVAGLVTKDVNEVVQMVKGEYVISDFNLDSGMYYLRISVIDENDNLTNRFVRVFVTEIPLKSEALYIVAKQSNSIINVYRCDSFPEYEKVLTLYTDYSGSAINSLNSIFYICGRHTGPMAAYDIVNNHQLLWKDDAIQSPPFPYFEGMGWDGKNAIAGHTDGRIKAYMLSGNTAYVFLLEDMWPRVFLRHYDAQQQKDYLVIGAAHYLMGMAHVISVHYDVSYANMQFLVTDWEMKKMFSKNSDEIYMFGNQSGQAVMKIYKISQNNTYTVKDLPVGSLSDVIRITPNVFIIAHTQGLFMYNYSYNSLTPYGSFAGGGSLMNDEVSGRIFYAVQGNIQVFDFLTQSIEGNINLADSIIRMHVQYNK
jgi:hypothetical protein